MNIAYFVWEYPPRLIGGLGTYAAEITKEFAAKGNRMSVFTMNDGDKLPTMEELKNITVHRPIVADASEILPVFVDDEIKRWGAGMRFFADVLSYNMLAANKFVNMCAKKEQFDVIACHDWLSAISGITAKSNVKKPLIFHVHSTEQGRSRGGGSSTIRELEKFAAQKADLIITVSYAMHDELERLGYPKEKIRVMWNGVDEKKYDMKNFGKEELAAYRKTLGVKESEKMVLFTGRLTFVKGIDTLVRAMPQVLSKVKNAKLVVLGRGEMEEEMRSLVAQLGIAEKVVFVNRWVDEKERLLLYACADAVCAPSRYEPFGIVSLEASSMGKPIVVGAGGLREAVLDGVTGLHCDPDNPVNISEKLIQMLTDEKLAASMGRKGRERVGEIFTWEKIAKQTLEIYRTLV